MFGTVGNSTKCEGDHQWKEMRTGNLIYKKTEIVKVLKKIITMNKLKLIVEKSNCIGIFFQQTRTTKDQQTDPTSTSQGWTTSTMVMAVAASSISTVIGILSFVYSML